MDVIDEIRLRNLRILIAEAGTTAKLARRLGGDPKNKASTIAQIVGKKAKKNLGPDLARELEVAMGRLRGWMDKDHSEENTSTVMATGFRASWVKEITWAEAGKGLGMDLDGSNADARVVYTSASIGERAFALRVRGDSMVDGAGRHSYPDGCTIIVDPNREAKPGDRVVVKLTESDEATFKQLEFDGDRYYLKPLNSRYPLSPMPTDAKIIGVVVQTQIDE